MDADPRAEPRGAAAAPPPGSLPAELTSLVGRAPQLEALAELLEGSRLLTLVGPGGCGKSRIALALAHHGRAGFPGGAWWVELTATEEPELAAERVAAAIGGDRARGMPPAEAAARRLAGRHALLALDNCEHVADACARLAGDLLGACPQLTILATSRQPLGTPGEQLWRVPGLALGDRDGAADLFLARARLAAPTLDPTPADLRAVNRICRSLDGMPLAIELAAARVTMLGIEEIADRLEHDTRFLRSTSPVAPARHRSIEATIDWSHRNLAPAERALLRRLSVFAGGFSLPAVEAVCADDGGEPADVLDALARLVDHSLVQVDGRAGERRYRLPDMVRRFAAERLAGSGEAAALQARHARHCLELLSAGDAAADRVDAERDDLRAALRTQLAADPDLAGRLAIGLWPHWSRRGAYGEARLWLEQALAVAERMAPPTRAGVLTGAGVLAFLQCEYDVAEERLRRALALYRELDDRRGVATVLQRLGSIARERGRYADARELHEQSYALWERLGDRAGVAVSLDYLGFAAWLAGDFAGAEPLCRRALDGLRAAGSQQEAASALVNLGAAAQYGGDLARAAEHLEQALAISRELGYSEGVAWALHELAIVLRRGHHPARAAGPLRESLLTHQRLGDRWRIASVLEEIAGGLLARLDPAAAAEALAAGGALRAALGTPLPPAERPDHDRALETVRARLSPGALAVASARGAERTLEAAIDAALAAVARLYGIGPDSARAPERAVPVLTIRERAVLDLLAQGRTNREIAAELFISASTAGVHVSNILRKLGATSRTQAAALAHQRGLL